MKTSLTKQGVRNLDAGRNLRSQPDAPKCKHFRVTYNFEQKRTDVIERSYCLDCGEFIGMHHYERTSADVLKIFRDRETENAI